MINLHHIVRSVIPALHPDEKVYLILSKCMANNRGVVSPRYEDPLPVGAQIQSYTTDDLIALNEEMRKENLRKAYLYSDTPQGLVPEGILRSLSRGGDLIYREDGSWWLIKSMMEDFSTSGWVSVGIVQQVTVDDAAKSLVASL